MKDESLLDEIRSIRERHAKQCNYDIELIAKDTREGEKRLAREGWKIVHPPARRLPASPKAASNE
jgi:hypothetical protein